jgi:hypothetical protein
MSVPLATLELMSARSPQEPLGTIALPIRDHLNSATVRSLMQTDWSFVGAESGMDRVLVQGNILPLQRNEAIQRMRGHFILFIDDDMTWEPDAIGRLVDSFFELDHSYDDPVILGGLCFRRSAPYAPTMYMRVAPGEGPYNFLEKWDTDVVEVDGTGMAFILIPKTALEQMAETEMPPFEERIKMPGPPAFFNWTGRMGEDLRFCQDAKAAGVRIFVDTRIEIGHISEVEIRREQFLVEIAKRSPTAEHERRESNDLMGLPTMTAAEARQILGW